MQILTRDGRPWQPAYLLVIDVEQCIGCGRCFKVCGRGVMTLKAVDESGAFVDPDSGEVERSVMALEDAGACIGCGACGRVCPTDCQKHGPGREAS